MRLSIIINICFIFSIPLLAQIQYSDVALQIGIDHQYLQGGPGGGVSFVDFDGDGWDDVTLATAVGDSILFFKNINGAFQKTSSFVDHTEESKHVLWVDFDNDDDLDLYVTTFEGANRLYENNGNLEFIDITEAAGFPIDSLRHFGAAWADYDRDGWLDLYYTERKSLNSGTNNQNRLFRNNADGTFTEKTDFAQVADENKLPFCAAFFDYDNDRWPDIYIANDKAPPNTLFRNNGNGTFMDVSFPTQSNVVMSAMCVAIADYNNDANQDVYISNIATGNVLLQNHEISNTHFFMDQASDAGVEFFDVAWGCNFLDADNDRKLDLYVSGATVGSTTPSSTFYKNDGNGIFSETFDGFDGDTVKSYCNAIGDFNQDGFPDIMVSNFAPFNSQLWQNGGGTTNWIKVNLQGVKSNRQGIGSKIEVYAEDEYQMRYTHCGIAYMGQNSDTEIIGLANANVVDSIKITWPAGHVDVLFQVAANQTIEVIEGSTTNGNIDVDDDVVLTTPTIMTDFHFVEAQDEAMIDHYFSHDIFIGGGAAFFDYDNDGDDDLYITAGLEMDHFYENNGDGTFTDKSFQVGLLGTQYYFTTGVVAGDIDNDGFKDLFVTTNQSNLEQQGKNLLFRNNGNGMFQDIWNQIQPKDKTQAISAVFTDYDLDGLLDIYVISYVENASFTTDPNGTINGFSHDCYANTFYKNLGNGQFEEVAEVLQINDNGCSLAVVSTDFDMDGDMDIYLANDFGEFIETNHLYKNVTIDSVIMYDEIANIVDADLGMYGMGIAVGDVDRDLDLDYYVTNFGKNALLRNDGDFFTNITDVAGVGDEWIIPDSLLAIGWGTSFLDIDNDSDLDLYVANGFVPSPSFLNSTLHMNDKLFINEGNLQFTDTDTIFGIQNKYASRGMAYSDYDNDGDLDVLSVVLNVPINGSGWKTILYRNEKGNEKNWLQVSLEGVDVNRDAYGSKIFVHADGNVLFEEVSGGSSHASHHSSRIHFGLDTISMVDSIEVLWTGGNRRQLLYDIEANKAIEILEDTTLALLNESTMMDTIVIDATIDLTKNNPSMEVAPNPTKDILNVEIKNNQGAGELLLYNILGQLKKGKTVAKQDRNVILDLGEMEAGVYILTYLSEGVMLTRKILLEKNGGK